MKPLLKTAFGSRSAELYWQLGLLLLPILVLLVLGILWLWQGGLLWWFSGGVLCISLLMWLLRKLAAGQDIAAEGELSHLPAKEEWSADDRLIWERAKVHIDKQQLLATPWESFAQALQMQLNYVAGQCAGERPDAAYAFTLPEGLLLLEKVSRDYRRWVLANVPLSDVIKLDKVSKTYRQRDKLNSSYRLMNRGYRLLRLPANPFSAVMSEVSGYLSGSLFDSFSVHLQRNLKYVLLEQLTQAAIELYSGRLKLSPEELALARDTTKPELPAETLPLRIVVAGQVNAGKSTLINALLGNWAAAVDVLPTTDELRTYRCTLPDGTAVELLDSPGLDGSDDVAEKVLEQAINADMLLWLSSADQPAKALDKALLQRWNVFFSQQPRRRQPPLLLLASRCDLLATKKSWSPPYDLGAKEGTGATMHAALDYLRESLALELDTTIIPIAVPDKKDSYNVTFLAQLLASLAPAARGSQHNRRQLAAGVNQAQRLWSQALGLGKVLGSLSTKPPRSP